MTLILCSHGYELTPINIGASKLAITLHHITAMHTFEFAPHVLWFMRIVLLHLREFSKHDTNKSCVFVVASEDRLRYIFGFLFCDLSPVTLECVCNCQVTLGTEPRYIMDMLFRNAGYILLDGGYWGCWFFCSGGMNRGTAEFQFLITELSHS